MNKKIQIALLMSLFVLFVSCDQNENLEKNDAPADNGNVKDLTIGTNAANTEEESSEIFGQIDDLAEFDDLDLLPEGRVEKKDKKPKYNCADIIYDRKNKTITIDYGDSCIDKDDVKRSGKIIITYSDKWFMPGATQTITFDDFYINDIKVEGIRKWENVSDSTNSDSLKIRISLQGGKLTWPDSTTATRDAQWDIVRYRANVPANDERYVDGSASGTTKDGDTYLCEITKTLVYKRNCGGQYYFIPVSGIKQLTVNGQVVHSIDYGNGDCDNLAEETINGNTNTIELRGIGKWRNKYKNK